ncbi:3-keto-disaccharide hydrolase [Alienimonas chondri]|uniref:3-keto-alpha-glucoside-1,2-lyase/3-keto-2-hydroxy-glucal hydratase domain-containing protein n=1 Tax=Alienimonas chondri TaxID=2681879 RepID=A0ABX1VAW0_9PLAN|nr:DUF1080 domain-containing protein [Alienimonas chondri]NNJ25012.1 hypothetical protein [Alienimonas chondri]
MSAAFTLVLLCAPGFADHHEGDAKAGEPIVLFDGKSLDGWTAVLADDTDPKTVWSVEDGLLRCTGRPKGYIKTDRQFKNYSLSVKWRWTGKPGNNGVLVHATTPNALNVWPMCQEVQLMNGNAGDFWVIGSEIKIPLEGVPGYEKMVQGRRHLNFVDGAENPVGEWNEMTVICRDATITVLVNGKLVNYGFDSTVTEGSVCLQSEGAPIEYKDIVLTPLAD